METGQLLDLLRNLLLAGVLTSIIIGIWKFGRSAGRAESELKHVGKNIEGLRDEVKEFHGSNSKDHERIEGLVEGQRDVQVDHGNRLTRVETKVDTMCKGDDDE